MKHSLSTIFLLTLLFANNFVHSRNLKDNPDSLKQIEQYIKSSQYQATRNAEQSVKQARKALKLSNTQNTQKHVAQSFFQLGYAHYNLNQYDSAIYYLDQAAMLSMQTGSNQILANAHNRLGNTYQLQSNYNKDIYHDLYKIYREKTQYQKALEYYSDWARLKDNLNNQKISELEMQYDFEKKQEQLKFEQKKQQAIQDARLKRQSILIIAFIIGFILYKPKNIVSGDFYWINQIDSKIVIAAADCTGHGVPGAFMSMLGTAFLNEIITQNRVFDPGKILTQLRSTIINALHQDTKKRSTRDGMNITLSIIDLNSSEIYFSGAYNPMYIIRNNSIIELKANRSMTLW